MSEPPDLHERLQRGAETVRPGEPSIERIVTRGRRRRTRAIVVGVVVAVVATVGVAGPLIALSRLGGDKGTSPAATPAPIRTTAVGYSAVLSAPSNLSLLLWGESGKYWPQGQPDSQPLFQLSNVDPGLFTAADPSDAWWCSSPGGPPSGAAALIVRVTATSGADQNLPEWPVSLQTGSNACGEGQTAAWRVGDTSFDALVEFGDGATDADRQAMVDAFSSLRFDDDPRWLAITGATQSSQPAPIQVLDGGFLRGTPWLLVAFPDRDGAWFCSGSIYPWDVPAGKPGGQPAAAGCEKPSPDSLAGEVLNYGAGCIGITPDRLFAQLEGYADAKVASIVIEMNQGDRWVTTPVNPPPGVNLGGARLWVAPRLDGVGGIATAYNDAGQQVGDPTKIDKCEAFAQNLSP